MHFFSSDLATVVFCVSTLILSLGLLQVPGGPAHNHLEPGDVLIRMNGEVSLALTF